MSKKIDMNKKVDIEQIDFEIGKDINKIFENNSKHRIEPNMLDYLIGDPEKTEELSSVRFDAIKAIDNDDEKIHAMAEYLETTIIKQNFPHELYIWLARDALGLQYKKYEIEDMKRKYKIEKKRELKKQKEDDKKNKQLEKQKKKCLKREVKDVILKF